MDNTFISFYLKEYKIRVFTEALRGLDNPKRICFMLDEDGNRLLMLPHEKKDFVSHAVPDSVYSGGRHMEVNSKKLCWLLADQGQNVIFWRLDSAQRRLRRNNSNNNQA